MSSRILLPAVAAAVFDVVRAEGPPSSGGGGGGHGQEGPTQADFENIDVQHWMGWIWVAIAATFFIYQITYHLIRYVRTIACLNNENQRYFAEPNAWFARFKRYLLDAPLFRARHHREFKLSAAINIGTLPSRLQMFFIVGYFITNVVFVVINIDFSEPIKVLGPEIRNRFGVLAVMNMIPLFLMAGRNNPLITFCGISFDTFNLMHRWVGRTVVLEAIGHTLAWLIPKVQTGKLP
jgi:hypothetical protein